MKLTLQTLLNSNGALSTLGNTRGLASVVAYRIAKNIKLVDAEMKMYDETRIKLLEEYSEKGNDGKPIIKEDSTYDVTDDKMDTINKELSELRKEEIELTIKKVSLSEIEVAGLSPLELTSLEFMIEFENEDKEEK